MTRVVVTGATGFVGRHACRALARAGYTVVAVVRGPAGSAVDGAAVVVPVGDLTGDVAWGGVLAGATAVVHLAARVHVMRETEPNAADAFRAVNVRATERLAAAAAAAGVQRFVYVSSVKVHGDGADRAYTELDELDPPDAYGVSKLEAERAVWRVAGETGMEAVVLRPPLVYGQGVGGNFRRLFQLLAISTVVPLPLARVTNRRSMIFVENLADAIVACVGHPSAAGEVFLVSDGEDLSTPELLRRLAQVGGRRIRLLPVPRRALLGIARALRREEEVTRLVGSLRVDSSKIRNRLGWQPPYSVADGLRATSDWHRQLGSAKPVS